MYVYIIRVFYHRRPQKHIKKKQREKTVLNTRYTISHFLRTENNYQLFPLLNTNVYPYASPSACSVNSMPISYHTHAYGSLTWDIPWVLISRTTANHIILLYRCSKNHYLTDWHQSVNLPFAALFLLAEPIIISSPFNQYNTILEILYKNRIK